MSAFQRCFPTDEANKANERKSYSVNTLPVIADMIDAGLSGATEFSKRMLEAYDKPDVRKDAIGRRAVHYHKEGLLFVLARTIRLQCCETGLMSLAEMKELMRLKDRAAELKKIHMAGLALARKLAEDPIEQEPITFEEGIGNTPADIEKLVARLDQRACEFGALSDVNLFTAMIDYMPLFKQLLNRIGSHLDLLDALAVQYPGFAFYVIALDNILKVPRTS